MKKFYKLIILFMIALLSVGCAKPNNTSTEIPNESHVTQETETVEETEEETDSYITEHTEIQEEPVDDALVLILDYIPDMVINLRYATTDNFVGKVIYDNDDAYLRYGTVKKLMQVQTELKSRGYKLLLWDGYRPVEAQFKLWEICPDSRYVANPHKGFSKHSRGNTVDISIVTLDGQYVEMPTGFDDFSKKADRDYSDVSETAAKNSKMLDEIMTKAGFKGYSKEWWHYYDTTEYPVIQ